MRLVDADALIISDEECVNTICRDCKMQVNGCEDFFNIIKNAPTIEPERKKGKWGIINLGAVGVFDSCSECKRVVKHKVPFYNFCPNCGADMRGGQE